MSKEIERKTISWCPGSGMDHGAPCSQINISYPSCTSMSLEQWIFSTLLWLEFTSQNMCILTPMYEYEDFRPEVFQICKGHVLNENIYCRIHHYTTSSTKCRVNGSLDGHTAIYIEFPEMVYPHGQQTV